MTITRTSSTATDALKTKQVTSEWKWYFRHCNTHYNHTLQNNTDWIWSRKVQVSSLQLKTSVNVLSAISSPAQHHSKLQVHVFTFSYTLRFADSQVLILTVATKQQERVLTYFYTSITIVTRTLYKYSLDQEARLYRATDIATAARKRHNYSTVTCT